MISFDRFHNHYEMVKEIVNYLMVILIMMNMHYQSLERNLKKFSFGFEYLNLKPELKVLSLVFYVEGGDDLSISCKIFGICCVDV